MTKLVLTDRRGFASVSRPPLGPQSDRQELVAFVVIFPNLSRLHLSARIDPSEVILPESLLKEHRTALVQLVADLERSSPRIVEIALDRSVATDPANDDSGDHPVALDQPFSCERQTWTRRSPDDAFEPRSGVVEGGRVLFARCLFACSSPLFVSCRVLFFQTQ